MKFRRAHKGHYIKPKPLFYLTWKFKIIALTLRAALALYLVGCRMEHLVGSSFQWLLSVNSLCYRTELNYRMAKHTVLHAFQTQAPSSPSHIFQPRFDTDSFRIGIDTLCSVTMSGKKECFCDLHLSEGDTVVGIAGGLVSQGTGTFCFDLEDDSGTQHTIRLPHSHYIPGLPQTLLCPQHWAQLDDDNGTYIKNTAKACWLVWNKGRSKKFVPLDPKTNTPACMSAPGTFNYCACM